MAPAATGASANCGKYFTQISKKITQVKAIYTDSVWLRRLRKNLAKTQNGDRSALLEAEFNDLGGHPGFEPLDPLAEEVPIVGLARNNDELIQKWEEQKKVVEDRLGISVKVQFESKVVHFKSFDPDELPYRVIPTYTLWTTAVKNPTDTDWAEQSTTRLEFRIEKIQGVNALMDSTFVTHPQFLEKGISTLLFLKLALDHDFDRVREGLINFNRAQFIARSLSIYSNEPFSDSTPTADSKIKNDKFIDWALEFRNFAEVKAKREAMIQAYFETPLGKTLSKAGWNRVLQIVLKRPSNALFDHAPSIQLSLRYGERNDSLTRFFLPGPYGAIEFLPDGTFRYAKIPTD